MIPDTGNTRQPGGPQRLATTARGRLRRVPLRIKLIAALLALVTAALLVISTASVLVFGDYLTSRADQQVKDFYHLSLAALQTSQTVVPDQVIPSGPFIEVVRPPGVQLPSVSHAFGFTQRIALPAVPVSPAWVQAHAGQLVTVRGLGGGGSWAVIASPISYTTVDGARLTGTLIVGVDLGRTVSGAIGRLTVIDAIVSVILLAGLAIVGIAMVRASLRPLTDIEQTAQSIAAGDLSRRVPDDDPATEVGRLGKALNAMLAQIEQAFRARSSSEEAARRSEDKMRRFIADASHELRTPLTTIRGYAEHYRQRGGVQGAVLPAAADVPRTGNGTAAGPAIPPSPTGPLSRPELDRLMRRVEDQAARMGVLVDDLLLLARLDQQRPLERRTVDLLALAADAAHDARLADPDRAITVTVGSGAALLVLGDEARLRQVIGNLMRNALTHTPPGTAVELRLRPGRLSSGQPAAILEVADQGRGLTPEQASRVFERFYRADQARTSAGAGLGLSIVAALIAAHGGQVWVRSPASGGAVFAIALPLAQEAIDAGSELDDDPGHDERPGAPPARGDGALPAGGDGDQLGPAVGPAAPGRPEPAAPGPGRSAPGTPAT